jgi:hypothetical protein
VVRLPYLIERGYLVDRGIPDGQDAPVIVSVELLGESSPPYVWELRLREGPGALRKGPGKLRSAVGVYNNEPEARMALQRVYDAYRQHGKWRVKTPEPPI